MICFITLWYGYYTSYIAFNDGVNHSAVQLERPLSQIRRDLFEHLYHLLFFDVFYSLLSTNQNSFLLRHVFAFPASALLWHDDFIIPTDTLSEKRQLYKE